MSGSKGGTTTQEIRLPEAIERASAENLAMADEVGRIGYVPYQGPTVAGMSDTQQASLANTNAAAQAFGMASAPPPMSYQPQGQTADGSQPQAANTDQTARSGVAPPIQAIPGGIGYGYSPYALYEQARQAVPAHQRGAIESFTINSSGSGLPSRPVPEVTVHSRDRGKK